AAAVERTGPTPSSGEPRLVPTPSGSLPLREPGEGARATSDDRGSGGDERGPGRGGATSRATSSDRRSLAVRQGLAAVRGVRKPVAEQMVAERDAGGPFTDLRNLVRRVRLSTAQLESLATAGALESLGVERRAGVWAAGALAQE